MWIDWAFSLEIPTGGFDDPSLRGATRTPTGGRARSRDEEESVDIAWGGGEPEGASGPVVLDDIPDVSEKHLAPTAAQLAAEPQLDDLPTPRPVLGPPRGSAPEQGPPRRATVLGHAAARSETRTTARDAAVVSDDDIETVLAGSELADDTQPAMAAAPPRISEPQLRGRSPSGPPLVPTRQPTPRPTPRPTPSVADPAPTANETEVEGSELADDTQPAMAAAPPRISEPQLRGRSPSGPPLVPTRQPTPRPTPRPTPSVADPAPAADPQALLESTRTKRPSYGPSIGQAIAARAPAPRRTWVLLLGIVTAGAAATAITLFATRGQDTVHPVTEQPSTAKPTKTVGTVKFVTEPVDAEISIEGTLAHTGTPWVTELEAGIHQVSINRAGHKAWLTSLELSPGEIQTLRVVLEPLGTASPIADATLIIRSTPDNLEAVLDGQVLPVKTPIKMPLRVGPHTVVLRQNGIDVWRQELVAQAAADYEFSPSMTADKQRERAQYVPPREAVAPVDAGKPHEPPVAPLDAGVAETKPPEPIKPPEPKPPEPIKPPEPKPPVVTAKPVPPPTPMVRIGAVTVAPSAVTRLSGTPPEIAKSKTANMPAVVAAKVCIDAAGAVSSAQMITKVDRSVSSELVDAIEAWKYAPYKVGGAAMPACFVVSFRVK